MADTVDVVREMGVGGDGGLEVAEGENSRVVGGVSDGVILGEKEGLGSGGKRSGGGGLDGGEYSDMLQYAAASRLGRWVWFQPNGTDIYAVGGQVGSCRVMQVGVWSLFPQNHYICSFHMCIHCSWHALCSDYFFFNALLFFSFLAHDVLK